MILPAPPPLTRVRPRCPKRASFDTAPGPLATKQRNPPKLVMIVCLCWGTLAIRLLRMHIGATPFTICDKTCPGQLKAQVYIVLAGVDWFSAGSRSEFMCQFFVRLCSGHTPTLGPLWGCGWHNRGPKYRHCNDALGGLPVPKCSIAGASGGPGKTPGSFPRGPGMPLGP